MTVFVDGMELACIECEYDVEDCNKKRTRAVFFLWISSASYGFDLYVLISFPTLYRILTISAGKLA